MDKDIFQCQAFLIFTADPNNPVSLHIDLVHVIRMEIIQPFRELIIALLGKLPQPIPFPGFFRFPGEEYQLLHCHAPLHVQQIQNLLVDLVPLWAGHIAPRQFC